MYIVNTACDTIRCKLENTSKVGECQMLQTPMTTGV